MEDPRGSLSFCKYCNDTTSSTHTSSSKVICTACGKDKVKYINAYNIKSINPNL